MRCVGTSVSCQGAELHRTLDHTAVALLESEQMSGGVRASLRMVKDEKKWGNFTFRDLGPCRGSLQRPSSQTGQNKGDLHPVIGELGCCSTISSHCMMNPIPSLQSNALGVGSEVHMAKPWGEGPDE